MSGLVAGGPAPLFTAPTLSKARFYFGSLGGLFVVLAFLPDPPEARAAMLAQLRPHLGLLDDQRLTGFLVARDRDAAPEPRDRKGLRCFLDPDGAVARQFGALAEDGSRRGLWVLVDPSLRVMGAVDLQDGERLLAQLPRLPDPDQHAGTPLHAPVLIVPRVLEPQLCRRLIDYYHEVGGAPSGVMREEGGKTVGVLDDFKKRYDAQIRDEGLRAALRSRLKARLLPEIEKAFQFKADYVERYIVARYDASDGGYFRPHRDNTTAGTAHRRFAVSINLNAEEFEGGDLRFPEFGRRTYRPPTGGAVVFSCSLLHEATPVTRGVRYATLPFLYDRAGEDFRRRHLHLVDSGEAAAPDAPAAAQAG